MNAIALYMGINVNLNFAVIFASLLWVRILTIIAVIPFLFGNPVPRTVKTGAAFMFMIFAFRSLYPSEIPVITEDKIVLALLYMKEAFIGLTIGFVASLMFYGFEAAGHMIDNQRGMSIARILIPGLGQGSITSGFLYQLAVVIYLSIGGHLAFLDAIFSSYDILPIFDFPKVGMGLMPMMDFIIKLTGKIISLSIQISAPVIISLLIADIILGTTNRVAPQINVWELGFNVKGWSGILILFLSMTVIVSQMQKYTLRANKDITDTITYFDKGMPDEAPSAGAGVAEGVSFRAPEGRGNPVDASSSNGTASSQPLPPEAGKRSDIQLGAGAGVK